MVQSNLYRSISFVSEPNLSWKGISAYTHILYASHHSFSMLKGYLISSQAKILCIIWFALYMAENSEFQLQVVIRWWFLLNLIVYSFGWIWEMEDEKHIANFNYWSASLNCSLKWRWHFYLALQGRQTQYFQFCSFLVSYLLCYLVLYLLWYFVPFYIQICTPP